MEEEEEEVITGGHHVTALLPVLHHLHLAALSPLT